MGSRKQSYIACVTGQLGSERIIRAASCIADDAGAAMTVLSVLTGTADSDEIDALEYLHDITRDLGAEMTVLYSENPVLAACEYIKRRKITHVVTGMPDGSENGFIELLRAVLPKVKILMIPTEDQTDILDDSNEEFYCTAISHCCGKV